MSTSSVVSFDLTIDSPVVPKLVTRFHTFAAKTVEGILEMGRVVNEASKLKKSEFAKFCELVELDGKDSTVNKLKTIGEKYEFLLAHSSKLPSSWTTVYEIARLTEDQITNLIDRGVLKATLAAQELSIALGKPKKLNGKKTGTTSASEFSSELGFRVLLTKSPDRVLTQKIGSLLEQLRELPLDVFVGSGLEAFFEPVEA